MPLGSNREHRSIAEHMQRAPDAVVLPFLGGLRTRGGELADAVGGRALRMEVVVDADRRAVYRIVFTPTGTVELTGAYGFDPHLRVAGSPDEVIAVLVGALDTFDAVHGGVLTMHYPFDDVDHFPAVRALLAREIRACGGSRPA